MSGAVTVVYNEQFLTTANRFGTANLKLLAYMELISCERGFLYNEAVSGFAFSSAFSHSFPPHKSLPCKYFYLTPVFSPLYKLE